MRYQNPLVAPRYEERIETTTTTIRFHTRRVFVLRIAFGGWLLRLAVKIMGATAEVLE